MKKVVPASVFGQLFRLPQDYTSLVFFVNMCAPWMLEHGLDAYPSLHVSVQHLADQVDAVLAHHVRHSQVMVHDFVNRVKGVFLVHDGVEQDAQSPYVLLLAPVW